MLERIVAWEKSLACASLVARRRPDLPLYTLRKLTTDETIQTTDPGRAMITGLWADLDRFKVPSLRGLAARAPYFHNGIPANLRDVVHLYEESPGFEFTAFPMPLAVQLLKIVNTGIWGWLFFLGNSLPWGWAGWRAIRFWRRTTSGTAKS